MMKERKFIPRKQIKFWLIRDLESDKWIMEIITYWKERRQFSDMIKSGIKLMWSLGKGNTDILFDLFPQLENQLAARYAPPTPPDTSALEKKIERLERLILEQGSLPPPPNGYPQSKSATPAIAAPVAAVTKAAAVSADEIASNFLSFIQ